MSKWHLYSEFKNGVNTGGRIEFVWLFGIIGIFVLLLACINFMNLSTARSEKRAKEVGIRKAIGSLRSQLIRQFFSESLLVAAFAFLLSLLLVQLILPYFNEVADKKNFYSLGQSFILDIRDCVHIDHRIYCRKLSCSLFIFFSTCKSFERHLPAQGVWQMFHAKYW